MSQVNAPSRGLTQIHAPSKSTLIPVTTNGKLTRLTAKSSLMPLKAKSKLVRLKPKSKLIRYRVKSANVTPPLKSAPVFYAFTDGALSYFPQKELAQLLDILGKDIYQFIPYKTQAAFSHQFSWKLKRRGDLLLRTFYPHLLKVQIELERLNNELGV
ncbi:hypothetical protein [Pseudovibrio sp. Tun.PSC04-5.I4]|uniref:hypothetical protein n=1 Tax=Pseudovibrio sp. Tun.PSC04-5.I4 TaxID=1798213 RepID=UPI0013563D68|nr:hypothetical protein [Pseudovibrio sp. Tun.PSC04-5.I4]